MNSSSSSTSSSSAVKKKYALKRINCSDHELLQSCRHEAGIHRSLPSSHPNLLELLGLKFEQDHSRSSSSSLSEEYNVCHMLFPYLPNSLRGEITLRNILNDHHHQQQQHDDDFKQRPPRRRPFATEEALHIFSGILNGLMVMHNANISHRDVKLENVLLSPNSFGDHHHHHHRNHHHNNTSSSRSTSRFTPILMDFGSAGPLQTPPLKTRNSILQIIELASSHTTFPYRPPELSEAGNLRPSSSCVVDYGKVDVWSLGCVLFGLLHGVSPFEMEFVKGGSYGYSGRRSEEEEESGQYGLVRVVECTTLKILGEVPLPPWAGSGLGGGSNNINNNNNNVGDGSSGKYPLSIYKFIRYMVQHDRTSRPNIHEVAKRFGELYYELLREEWIPYSAKGTPEDEEQDDFDSLIASRDFV